MAAYTRVYSAQGFVIWLCAMLYSTQPDDKPVLRSTIYTKPLPNAISTSLERSEFPQTI